MSITVPPSAIQLSHVSFFYNGHAVIDDVSLDIPQGSYVGIVGPNGGGKTTLIRLLLGLLEPNRGSITLFGMPPCEARRYGNIGYVPQRVAQSMMHVPCTVQEVVQSGRTAALGIGHFATKHDIRIADEYMERLRISHLQSRLIYTLSGGERQRVFIARALASLPRILILDEPMTGVDGASKELFYDILASLHADLGINILFVSHDVEVVTQKASSILALNRSLLCYCHSDQFLCSKHLSEIYGSSCHHHYSHSI